jgi:hypothetical protein
VRKRHHAKLLHEGKYAAEVDVELVETGEGWSPYLSLEDAYKLDAVREGHTVVTCRRTSSCIRRATELRDGESHSSSNVKKAHCCHSEKWLLAVSSG